MRSNRHILAALALGIVTVAGALFIYPYSIPGIAVAEWRPWKLGLDLVGGSHLIYTIDVSGIPAESRNSVTDGLRDVIEQRVNLFGVSEPNVFVATEGEERRLIVELAGISNAEEAIAQIGRTASLDFREMNIDEETQEVTFVRTDLTGRYLNQAQIAFDPTTGEPQIALRFNSEGATLFEQITRNNVGKQVCAFVDDVPLSCPRVNEVIPGGQAVINGQFTLQEARTLTNFLNAGALPAPITLINQKTISASLGQDSLRAAIAAGIGGTLLIMLFMVAYYRKSGFGIFAVVALLVYIVLALTLFKLVPVTMTLASVAGFLLSIGMAVDANILIFERINEERRRGVAAVAAIEEGFRRAWPSIRDSNITTMLSAVLLYYFTSSFVRGFALTLLIGVIISMFTAITVTRGLIRSFAKF